MSTDLSLANFYQTFSQKFLLRISCLITFLVIRQLVIGKFILKTVTYHISSDR